MNEKFFSEWIYFKRQNVRPSAVRVPKDIEFPTEKGYYLIKIYKLGADIPLETQAYIPRED